MSGLSVFGLTVRFGRITAVTDAELVVEPGTVLAILGRNGAGKSTLLRAIAGAVKPSSGKVSWDGRDVTHLSPDRKARMGMVLIPEGRRIFPNLTVVENLTLGGFWLDSRQLAAAFGRVHELFPILQERADSPAAELSGGQQQILAIGRGLMADPSIMLLDEPSLGLAPSLADTVYDELAHLKSRGLTILLVEQHISRALELADQALVMSLGKIVLEGDPAALARDPRLIGAYMGGSDK